jgi:hypothetical protein
MQINVTTNLENVELKKILLKKNLFSHRNISDIMGQIIAT